MYKYTFKLVEPYISDILISVNITHPIELLETSAISDRNSYKNVIPHLGNCLWKRYIMYNIRLGPAAILNQNVGTVSPHEGVFVTIKREVVRVAHCRTFLGAEFLCARPHTIITHTACKEKTSKSKCIVCF